MLYRQLRSYRGLMQDKAFILLRVRKLGPTLEVYASVVAGFSHHPPYNRGQQEIAGPLSSRHS